MRGDCGKTYVKTSVQQLFKISTLMSHGVFTTILQIVEHVDEHRILQPKEKGTIKQVL